MRDEFEDFNVRQVYPERMYERKRFSVTVNDEEFSGDFLEGEVQWRQPQPPDEKLSDELEAKVSKLMRERGARGTEH